MSLSRFLVLATLIVVGVAACRPKRTAVTYSDDSIVVTVDTSMALLSGAIDDQVGSSFSLLNRKKSIWEYLKEDGLLASIANAAACSGRANTSTCTSGVKTKTYTSCTLSSSSFTVDGTVTLTYSDTVGCALTNPGDTVNRTANMTYTGPLGIGVVTSNSAGGTDFRGISMTGGLTITQGASASTYSIDVGGFERVRTNSNGTLYDVTVRTTSSIGVTGGLTRGVRVLNGGSYEASHNALGFVTKMSFSNVIYGSSSCCYPTSGTINLTFAGSVGGTGTVTFTDCGTATLNRNDHSTPIVFSYCE